MADGAGLRPKKSLGQHFLRDDEVHEEILHWAQLETGDNVLEIGAGDGTLTRSLGERAGRVIAVETDRRCLRLLRKEFPAGGAVEVVEADILEYDLASLGHLKPLKVIADLPYNIATAVLDSLLDMRGLFSLMVLMFQKEVARRLVASPATRDYGSLSLATQYRAEAAVIRTIPPGAFYPPPRVESALVRIVPRPDPLLPPREERVFLRLVRDGFRHRRKTLLNSLARAGSPLPEEEVAAALQALALSPKARAESLSLADFLSLARILAGAGADPASPHGTES